MSNSILPHLLSDSPPPLEADEEDFEDEFGDFKGPGELSFDNEIPSTPPSIKNSKDYFPDDYTDFNVLNNGDKGYELFDTSQNKSSKFINSIPTDSYFSLWEKLENDIPEIIDDDHENLPSSKKQVEVLEFKEEPKKLSTSNISNSSETSSLNVIETEFEIYSESIDECPKEETANFCYSNASHSLKENDDFQSVEFQKEIIPSKNIVNQSQSESICGIDQNQSESTENHVELSSFKPVETGGQNDSIAKDKYAKEVIERTVHGFHSSGFIGENVILIDNSLSQLQGSDEDLTQNSVDIDSVENVSVINEVSAVSPWSVIENQENEDDFGDFTGFSSCKVKNSVSNSESLGIAGTEEDDFYEFGSYKTISPSKTDLSVSDKTDKKSPKPVRKENGDFDDFTGYSVPNQCDKTSSFKDEALDVGLKICKTPEEALKETECILEKMFTMEKCTTAEYSNCDYVMNNSVFENLKDITDTNALTYQWGKSAAQKNILKTLNIDIRNILYGPSWNSGVPIFAANLCSKPLEPVKSEFATPVSPQKTIETQDLTIPQFDWSGSGLANLQESSENVRKEEPKKLHESPIINSAVLQPSYEDAALPTQSRFKKNDLSPVKVKNEEEDGQEVKDDFSEFSSYQGAEETKWNKMLPLRESHISYNPEKITLGKSDSSSIVQLEAISKFSFDSALEVSQNEQISEKSPSFLDGASRMNSGPVNFQHNSAQINAFPSEMNRSISFDAVTEMKDKHLIEEADIQSSIKQKQDDFTDFQSSLPCPLEPPKQPVLLEPLKPAILQPELVKNQPLKIEWPEPGLDEEEINRIVNGVLRKNSTNENDLKKTDSVRTPENIPKQPVRKNDHDDWSDFMSAKEPLGNRTSTPDLTLSVFNLSSIQPNKNSAPYVTPNGVVHSPSKTTHSFPVINRNTQKTQPHSHQQPFITSQAFSSLYSKTENNDSPPFAMNYSANINGVSFAQNGVKPNIHSSITENSIGDDDWGDFVSAPNIISQSNSSASFFPSSSYMKTNLGFHGRSASTQKFSVSKKTIVKQERKNSPIISTLPELDFVSPKSRNSIK